MPATPNQFMIGSINTPKVELTDAGLYIRFLADVAVEHTVVTNEWPHIAVDIASDGRVIGVEAVPAPAEFTIGQIPNIVANARVGGLPVYKAEDVQIENMCAAA